VCFFSVLLLSACGGPRITDGRIIPISREEGSGARGSFVDLFGIVDENKNDIVTINAEITNNTAVMISSVKTNRRAIGYITIGVLNDAVRAVKIDGVVPCVDNVKNGTYPFSRPFLIVTRSEVSALANDFIEFILSADGQNIVRQYDYVAVVLEAEAFVPSSIGGSIVVAGSSSVSPLMEKLREAYLRINPNANIEMQTNDSSTGVQSVINGIADIGMCSRNLKQSELDRGVFPKTIAKDGIAVIVNNINTLESLSKEDVKAIFTGQITLWKDILK